MWNVCAAWINDPNLEGHVPMVNLYAVMFKDHILSNGEWTLIGLQHETFIWNDNQGKDLKWCIWNFAIKDLSYTPWLKKI